MSKRHVGDLLNTIVFPGVFSPCLSCHLEKLLLLVVWFHTYCSSLQNAISASYNSSKNVWGRYCYLQFMLFGVCLNYWFLFGSWYASILEVSIQTPSHSLKRIWCFCQPSLNVGHMFCTHSPGRSVTIQALTVALIFLAFFQHNLLLMFHPKLFEWFNSPQNLT